MYSVGGQNKPFPTGADCWLWDQEKG